MSLDATVEALAVQLINEAARSMAVSTTQPIATLAKMHEAAEQGDDPAENFDGWMPLTLASNNRYYMYTLQELFTLRMTVRKLCDTNEVARNVQLHYRNFIVGKHISVDVVPADFGDDPVKLASAKKDSQVKKMLENWKLFTTTNKFDARCRDWVNRAHRDGEVIQRIFTGPVCPLIRFIDPTYIKAPGTDVATQYGILYSKDDAETPETFFYQPENATKAEPIDALEILYDKRNVDFGAPRGIPSFWPVLANLRRLEKVLVNSSVLAAVQAAITMVRKHKSATAAKVKAMVDRQSDGTARVDSVSGRAVVGRRIRPGTILDAPNDTEYEFPSHGVNAAAFMLIAEHEMAHIASNFVLPKSWLLADEPTEPLTPGSPTIAHFETEQEIMFENIHDVFWMVQGMMGINVEKNIVKYDLLFNGKRLAVGKALDEARVDEILQRIGAQGPQTTAAKHGNNWAQERAGAIKHRETVQPGEVMPGDAGATGVGGAPGADAKNGTQDGTTKKGGGQRGSDSGGGNNG